MMVMVRREEGYTMLIFEIRPDERFTDGSLE